MERGLAVKIWSGNRSSEIVRVQKKTSISCPATFRITRKCLEKTIMFSRWYSR